MLSTPINIKVQKGVDFSKIFTVTDEYDDPFNLTSYGVDAFYSNSYVSTNKYDFTSSIIDPLNGKIEIKLTNIQTAILKLPRYVYDIVVTSSLIMGDIKFRVFEGVMEVSPGVTYFNPTAGYDPTTNKIPVSLEQLYNVDTTDIQNNYVLIFDSESETHKFVPPSEIVDRADNEDDGSLDYGNY